LAEGVARALARHLGQPFPRMEAAVTQAPAATSPAANRVSAPNIAGTPNRNTRVPAGGQSKPGNTRVNGAP
jgi:hypothetical protein